MGYMGVDVGTSGCKAVVFDNDGRQLGAAYREYDLITTDQGGAELDSRAVMQKCLEVIGQSATAAGRGTVRGIGISSQGEAFTAVDHKGNPLTNGMVSSDVRSLPYVEQWVPRFGAERLYNITGHTAHPMFTLFKILWLRDRQPAVWNRADKFLCYEDLLQAQLGLDPAIGWPLAGRTMLFDVRQHTWHEDILAAVGLRPEQLARPLASGTVVGTIPGDMARDLGLGAGAIVVTAGHDQPCGALGAGVTSPGMAMYATGTVECITPVFAAPVFTEELRRSNLCTYDHAMPGMYVTAAFSLTGGNILKWFRDEFGAHEVAAAEATGSSAYERLLRAASPKPTSLLVLPYFTPSGTPYFDTRTKGAILGLSLSTQRGEILRALLEGVAFEMRLNLDILARSGCPIQELRAIGGGAKSKFWTQLKADILGTPITTLHVHEAGCLGAAMLARAADTGEPVTELASRWVQPAADCTPNPATSGYYDERFALYRQLYPALKEIPV